MDACDLSGRVPTIIELLPCQVGDEFVEMQLTAMHAENERRIKSTLNKQNADSSQVSHYLDGKQI